MTTELHPAQVLANIDSNGLIKFEDGSGLRLNGWKVQACARGGILNAAQIQGFEKRLGSTHLPEMIYGTNSLECTHEASGTTIRFDAFGALQGWLDEQAPPLEVASAQEWKESHDLTGKLVVAYDWTYTTKYEGDLLLTPKMLRSGGVDICQVSETASIDAHCQEAAPVNKCRQLAVWEVTEESIDRAALQRQEPILYFDEVNLYESELDDNGISRVNVKVRVMASSWYVLMRYWLRADGTLTRIRDTRIYCPFHATSKAKCNSSHVIREVTHREGNFEDLDPKIAAEARLNPDIGQQYLPITFQKVEKLRI